MCVFREFYMAICQTAAFVVSVRHIVCVLASFAVDVSRHMFQVTQRATERALTWDVTRAWVFSKVKLGTLPEHFPCEPVVQTN